MAEILGEYFFVEIDDRVRAYRHPTLRLARDLKIFPHIWSNSLKNIPPLPDLHLYKIVDGKFVLKSVATVSNISPLFVDKIIGQTREVIDNSEEFLVEQYEFSKLKACQFYKKNETRIVVIISVLIGIFIGRLF